jgi:hypothetical protein
VTQLGANAHGEVLVPGRVPDCYLGLRLDPINHDAEAGGVLVVAPAALLHPAVPQPDGTMLYELLTGHPDRAPRELVFLADLTVELRAWPTDTWAKVGVDPQAAAGALVAGWQHGDLLGLRLGGLDRRGGPSLGAASHDLRARPAQRPARPPAHPGVPAVAAAVQPPAGRLLPVTADTRRLRQYPGQTPAVRTPAAVPEAAVDSGCCGVPFRSRADTRSATTTTASATTRRRLGRRRWPGATHRRIEPYCGRARPHLVLDAARVGSSELASPQCEIVRARPHSRVDCSGRPSGSHNVIATFRTR